MGGIVSDDRRTPLLISDGGEDDDWETHVCRCPDGRRMPHIHCPWGGFHIHYVNRAGHTVPKGERW